MTSKNLQEWVYPEGEDPERLDKFLGTQPGLGSRAKIQAGLKEGLFTVNGQPASKNFKLKAGDFICQLGKIPSEDFLLQPEEMPLHIVFEDDHLAVINKPKNCVVHPGSGIGPGTLAAGLLHRFPRLSDIGGPMRPGIVHRLDKDTTGLLLVAKTNQAHRSLAGQLKSHAIKRIYRGLCWGEFKEPRGTIDKNLDRNEGFRLKRSVSPQGQRAITHFRVLQFAKICSWLELELETGRTHQIRIHVSSLGHPIVGDALYGGSHYPGSNLSAPYSTLTKQLAKLNQTQALHAAEIHFSHPITGAPMAFSAALPPAMQESLNLLEPHFQLPPQPLFK